MSFYTGLSSAGKQKEATARIGTVAGTTTEAHNGGGRPRYCTGLFGRWGTVPPPTPPGTTPWPGEAS